VLGNGVSVAVHVSLSHRSLLEQAVEEAFLPWDAQLPFAYFGTQDFELVLRIVPPASNVNRLVNTPEARAREASARVRDGPSGRSATSIQNMAV